MLNLFKPNDFRYATSYHNRYNRIKNISNSYLYVIKRYYQDKPRYLTRPNIFIKLIELLEIDLTAEPTDVYHKLDLTAIYIANQLKMITGMNDNSKPHTGQIIPNTTEYFLYHREDFNYGNNDYSSYSPIKCLYTNLDFLFFTHPQKYDNGLPGFDIFIYTIDPVQLGMSYYYWALNQLENKEDIDPAEFLYTIIFTNIINSIFDLTVVNRLIKLYNKDHLPTFKNYNPIDIPDLFKPIDHILEYSTKHLHQMKHKYEYKAILKNIPGFIKNNGDEILELPYIKTNKKITWVEWLSRLDYIIFLLENFDKKPNKDIINDLETSYKYQKNDRYFIVNNSFTQELLDNKFKLFEKLL